MDYVKYFLLLNALPLLLDTASLAMEARRRVRGRGSSGIPFPVTLLLYAYMCFRVAPSPLPVKLAMFGAAVAFQGALVLVILAMYGRLRWRRKTDRDG